MSNRLHDWRQRWLITADEATSRLKFALGFLPGPVTPAAPLDLGGLEPRILFSSTPIDAASLPGGDEVSMLVAVELEPAGVDAPTMETLAEETPRDQSLRELIIIDSAVPGVQQLLDDLSASRRDAEVFVLDADRDGVDQITAILESRSDVDSVHVVSHAEDGAVKLGNVWLRDSNLDGYAGQIASWQSSLSSDADILLYGCDLAGSRSGRNLIESISALSGADVAASVDDTGHADYGGNWNLEYTSGSIESEIAFSNDLQQDWHGKLSTITVDLFNDSLDGADGLTSLREAVLLANASGGDTIVLSAGIYTLSIGTDGEDNSLQGDLDINSDVTIIGAGAGATIIDGGGIDRVFEVRTGSGQLTLSDITIQGGSVSGIGGGILVNASGSELTLDRVIISANSATEGAGIYNAGTATLTDVWVKANGDAIATTEGGGLFNERTAILDRVTLSGNAAVDGAGIHNDSSASDLFLTNVTISGNTASGLGGGIHNHSVADVTNSTIVLNAASNGGGIYRDGGTVNLLNTIIALNTASSGPDVEGFFNSLGHNLIGNGDNSTGLINGVNDDRFGDGVTPIDPVIDLNLVNNGGFTPTHALLAGSTAIDPVGLTGAPPTDQRGVARDGAPDIGAFEAASSLVLSAAADTYIDSNNSSLNYGVSDSLVVDKSGSGLGNQRALLQFDLTTIPVGATILGATLNMQAIASSGGSFDINVYAATESWVEGGADGVADVANWNERENSTSWSIAGGSYDPTIVATLNTLAIGQHSWDLTALIQSWHTGATVNNGIIIGSPETGTESFTYGSREGATPPELEIYYSVANNPPTDIAPNSFSIAENIDTTFGTSVGKLIASDPDAVDTASWSIEGGPDELKFSIGGADNDELILTDGMLDHETQDSYSVLVRVTDSTMNTYEKTITVNVTDENDSPTGLPTVTGTIEEHETLTANTSGIDDEDGVGAFSYQWLRNGAPIGGAMSGTYVLVADDIGGMISVEVSYIDLGGTPEGPLTSLQTAAVLNVNDDPTLDNPIPDQAAAQDTPFSFQFAGNSFDDPDGDTLTYIATLDDSSPLPSWLSFDASTRTFSGTPANTDVGVMTIRVTAKDPGMKSAIDDFMITVDVIDEVPTDLTLNTSNVDENSANGTVVGKADGVDPERDARIAQLLAGNPNLTYSAVTGKFYEHVATTTNWSGALADATTRTENGVTGQLVTIRSAAEQAIVHAIAAGTGQTIWLGASDQNIEGDWHWYNGAVEGDPFWVGSDTGSPVNGEFENWETPGEPNNAGNEDFARLYASGPRDGNWDDGQGSSSHAYIIEWDADDVLDQTDPLTYSLFDDAGGRFAINADSGEITVANDSLLDFETAASHSVVIRVTDKAANVYDETVAVNLNDVNEVATDITLSNSDVDENTLGAVIGTVGVLDPDAGDTHIWSVDDARFEIVAGQLKLKPGQALNEDAEPTVNLTITATDQAGTGLDYNEAFVITVGSINEAPIADTESFRVTAGATLRVAGPGVLDGDYDPDGDALTAVRLVGPANGTLALAADGSFVYTPNSGFNGTDSFTYEAWDGTASSSSTLVTINVAPAIFLPPPPIDPGDEDDSDDPPPPPPVDDSEQTEESEEQADPVATIDGPNAQPATPTAQRPAVTLIAVLPTEEPAAAWVAEGIDNDLQTAADERDRVEESQGKGSQDSDEFGLRSQIASIYRISTFDPQWQNLDTFRDDLLDGERFQSLVVGAAVGVSIAVSVGQAVWAIKAGYMASTLVTTMPIWRSIDPLPVLEYLDDDQTTDKESLQTIIEQG